jgi:O-antigen ligase
VGVDPSLLIAWFGLIVAAVVVMCMVAVLLAMSRWAARMWWQSRLLIAAMLIGVLWVRFGSVSAAGVIAGISVVLIGWRLLSRRTFERVVIWPVRFWVPAVPVPPQLAGVDRRSQARAASPGSR